MSSLLTLGMLYLIGLSIHVHGECERRKQSRFGIIKRLNQ